VPVAAFKQARGQRANSGKSESADRHSHQESRAQTTAAARPLRPLTCSPQTAPAGYKQAVRKQDASHCRTEGRFERRTQRGSRARRTTAKASKPRRAQSQPAAVNTITYPNEVEPREAVRQRADDLRERDVEHRHRRVHDEDGRQVACVSEPQSSIEPQNTTHGAQTNCSCAEFEKVQHRSFQGCWQA
jgi:hypothetical protein